MASNKQKYYYGEIHIRGNTIFPNFVLYLNM